MIFISLLLSGMSKDLQKKIDILIDDLTVLENYVSSLFSFLPVPLCFASPQGVVLELNPAFERISGYQAFEMTGENLNNIFEDGLSGIIEETLERGFVSARETILKNKEGKEILVSVFTRQRRDVDDRAIGVFLTVFDLTEIKRAEEELQKKVEDLEEFQKMAVGREVRMVELKKEIKRLKEKYER